MNACFECGEPAEHEHHVIPKSLGGTQTVWLCEPHHGLVHDRAMVGHRRLTLAGIARQRRAGLPVGSIPPYGWREVAGRLERDEREQAVIVEICAARAAGLSLRAISQLLEERGVVARNGRPFAPATLASILGAAERAAR